MFISTRPLPRRAALLAAVLALLAAGCAGQPRPPAETERAERFRAMAEKALAEIASVHIEPTTPRALTAAGLDGLERLAPRLDFSLADGRALALTPDGTPVAEARLPEDAAPEPWAAATAAVLFRARAGTPALAEAADEALFSAYFAGMLSLLDPYSRYAGRKAARDARAEREGFGGIGVSIETHPDGARIAGVDPNKPGAAAGLLAGDRIVAIDGEPVGGMPLRTIVQRLRGPVDEAVTLAIARPGLAEPFKVAVGRTRIVPDTVFFSRRGRHAVIRISSFNQRTAKRLAEALARARRAAPEAAAETDEAGEGKAAARPATGLVIDLRGNPGGLLEQAVDSADLLLNSGLISRAEGRHPNSHQRFTAEPGDLAAGLPVVVLVNGASASAAEVLAAALQDRGRAVIVGMTSFGKGSIQTVVDLPNAGELYLTWARLHAPSGYPLDRLGVAPAICTAGAGDAVQVLERGLAERRAATADLIARRRGATPSDAPRLREHRGACPWQPHEGGDLDRAVAHLLLDSPALYARALEIAGEPAAAGS